MRWLVFGVIDTVRVIGGLLLFNAMLSWWFTGHSTWGYNGKWIDSRFYQHQVFGSYKKFTDEDLLQYDGTTGKNPIYLAINGTIYDVTSSRNFYGPKGAYSAFSGKDAGRAFANGCLNDPEQFTYDLRGLNLQDLDSLKKWEDFFANHPKYWVVGSVEHEPIDGELLGSCNRMEQWR